MEGVFIMRIENIQMVAQLYDKKSVAKTNKLSETDTTDQLEISQAGRDYQVKQLKNQIDSGEYSVTGDDFASKVIEKYNQFMF